MRKVYWLGFALFFCCKGFAQKGEQTAEILTSAVCDMCKQTIEYDLTFAKGIKEVNLDVDTKIVTVKFNRKKTSLEEIRKRITLLGYHADSLQRDSVAYDNLPFCCKDGGHHHEDDDHR